MWLQFQVFVITLFISIILYYVLIKRYGNCSKIRLNGFGSVSYVPMFSWCVLYAIRPLILFQMSEEVNAWEFHLWSSSSQPATGDVCAYEGVSVHWWVQSVLYRKFRHHRWTERSKALGAVSALRELGSVSKCTLTAQLDIYSFSPHTSLFRFQMIMKKVKKIVHGQKQTSRFFLVQDC